MRHGIVMQKDNTFPQHARPFLLYGFAQPCQSGTITICIDGLAPLHVNDHDNTVWIPEYGCHNFNGRRLTLSLFFVDDPGCFHFMFAFFACADKMVQPIFVSFNAIVDEVPVVRMVTPKKCDTAHHLCVFMLIG
ncbi:hypothetical protein TNCV_2799071 [Trichonephila clavipes]|nr:hypothetical protein TNCV_2799071 [Trichonephila clavipes]